ncbi:hypothetical protein SAMN04487970_104129 [Paenibacillus tianmuensis]|uniref:Uncharacterized protein n=1 Tax=Paenibacillus tianmuensis TaxID=624147 RepID=A0A1G4T3A4_9BACL|nr:hypothetical protein [Paenibacillus tianmuensis]SCW75781.1 hypothetical protein SAMN04487970_104129 [Paenibacillus tianmuensis]
MDLQLELLPYHYYNTLGFDAELIDYIDHVDLTIRTLRARLRIEFLW